MEEKNLAADSTQLSLTSQDTANMLTKLANVLDYVHKDPNALSHEEHLAKDVYAFFSDPVHWRIFMVLSNNGNSTSKHHAELRHTYPDIRSFFCAQYAGDDSIAVNGPSDMTVNKEMPVYHKVLSPTCQWELVKRTNKSRETDMPHQVSQLEPVLKLMSLNLLNFICTNYCTLVCVSYYRSFYQNQSDLFLPEGEFLQLMEARKPQEPADEELFILKSQYDAKLDAHCKKLFDPYAREPNVIVRGVVSSLKQLNYIKWAIENRVIHYACHNRMQIVSYKYCLHRNPRLEPDEPVKLIKKKYTRKRSEVIIKEFNRMRQKQEHVQYIFYDYQ